MIWVTWRQQRTETIIAAVLLLLAATLLLPTGLHMASVYDRDAIATCVSHPTGTCGETLGIFSRRWDSLVNLVAWFNLLPALIGVLFAAPLVLEFEHGTHRLAWTQSITRDRWLAVRLGLITGVVVLTMAVFTLVMTWWRGPLDNVEGRFANGFNFEGIVPTAYALFAAALVLAIGVVLRRGAAAIGLTLVTFVALRLGIEGWVRPHYRAAVQRTWSGSTELNLHGAWVISEARGLSMSGGGRPDPAAVNPCLSAGKQLDSACLARHGIAEYASAIYHPASRFWLFQGIEAGIFLVLALALGTVAVVWIRRRIA